MSFKVVKSGCCVGRCALACDSATRYIRLSSSRSQAHTHTYKYVHTYIQAHSHTSWHCLRVRSGRKISDPELNRHYFQLTRKQSRSYTPPHHTHTHSLRRHTRTLIHTHTQAGSVYASVLSICWKADFIWKFRITKCLSLYFMQQLHTHTHTYLQQGTAFVFVWVLRLKFNYLCPFCAQKEASKKRQKKRTQQAAAKVFGLCQPERVSMCVCVCVCVFELYIWQMSSGCRNRGSASSKGRTTATTATKAATTAAAMAAKQTMATLPNNNNNSEQLC